MSGERCEIRESVYPWQNVRKTGEDIVRGEILLPAYHRIRAYDQGALMAAGILTVRVFRKPRVLIIPSGDEIIPPEEAKTILKSQNVPDVEIQGLLDFYQLVKVGEFEQANTKCESLFDISPKTLSSFINENKEKLMTRKTI